ncbi:hypothetical protein H8356DRAFT_996592 [Neocallimastix lanati (nom. inval.)]|jgi:hypothetical protein|nr:hypothetical protein H8356DRAFT_996592 [Neocallimastix sp. JGI-2020a]
MTSINILCCYYLHGLDGSEKDFQCIKSKVKENFNLLFQEANKSNNIKNYHYGYCSNDNANLKSHAELKVMVDKSFNELNNFLENIVLSNFKNDYQKEYNNFENIPCNLYFSIIGHSLGGLISRGLAKKIYSEFEKDDSKFENYFEYLKKKFTFISTINPCSFLTLSTPHLGSLVNNENGGLIKFSMKTFSRTYCNFLSGSIGKTFIYKDNKNKKPGLIELCQKEYMDAYAKFPNRTLIGCVRNDIPVKICSAMGSIHHPLPEYEEEKLLVDNSKSDTRICSYSGYNEGEELEYYQKEIFNENSSKNMFYNNTKLLPPPNIDKEIEEGLEKIKSNKDNKSKSNENVTPPKYEEMDDVFIPDTYNQVEVAISALKLFNQISFRRIIIDFSLPGFAKMATHPVYIGYVIVPSNSTINAMVSKSVSLISNLILADYLRTSQQSSTFTLNSLINNENDENENKENENDKENDKENKNKET